MKSGHVVSIRVNPRDCQTVLDLLDKVGYDRRSITFAQCVSMALASLLETARKSEILPEPDEFQYLQRMQQYLGHKGQRARIATALHDRGGSFRAKDLTKPAELEAPAHVSRADEAAEEPATKQAAVPPTEAETVRFTELLKLEDQRELSPREKAEHSELMKKFYPDG